MNENVKGVHVDVDRGDDVVLRRQLNGSPAQYLLNVSGEVLGEQQK